MNILLDRGPSPPDLCPLLDYGLQAQGEEGQHEATQGGDEDAGQAGQRDALPFNPGLRHVQNSVKGVSRDFLPFFIS